MKNLWINIKHNLRLDNFKTIYAVRVRDGRDELKVQVKAFSYSGAVKQIKAAFKHGFIVNIKELG